MNENWNLKLFSLLADSSQVTNEEMHNAYGQFAAHMEAISTSEDYSSTFRTLNHTRIEVEHLQIVFRDEQGEKCPEKSVYLQNPILS
jgi:hypothetical protein